jgi:MFS family permease
MLRKDETPASQPSTPENPELHGSIGVRWVKKIRSAFPAFQSRNYTYYFYGQFISLIGTWLQIVAQGWLVLQLTNSAFMIGLVTAMSTLPSLLFTLGGGVIADRFPKRKILMYTQFTAMALALLFGVLTLLNLVDVWLISIFAFALGTVNAIDAPTRQSFVAELVNREQLTSAIALNSGTFNAARVIGPGLAGLLIGLIGTGGAFLINGISFLAVIIALRFIKTEGVSIYTQKINSFKSIGQGIHYAFTHPIISWLLILAGILSVFGWSYTTLMPLLAKQKFGVDATGLGYLYSASGAGSLLAAILVGLYSGKSRPVWFIVGGGFLFTLGIILFTFTSNLLIALPFLFISGFGLLAQASMVNSTIQNMVKPELRGRVMSLYVLMFLGMTPIGNLLIGWLSEKINPDSAIRISATVVLISAVFLLFIRKNILKAYHKYRLDENPH